MKEQEVDSKKKRKKRSKSKRETEAPFYSSEREVECKYKKQNQRGDIHQKKDLRPVVWKEFFLWKEDVRQQYRGESKSEKKA